MGSQVSRRQESRPQVYGTLVGAAQVTQLQYMCVCLCVCVCVWGCVHDNQHNVIISNTKSCVRFMVQVILYQFYQHAQVLPSAILLHQI